MNQTVIIAWRNVGRQKKRTVLLAGAIGFGFFIITLVGGVTHGLADNARRNFSGLFGGHIYVEGSEVSPRGSEIALLRDQRPLDAVLAKHTGEIAAIHRRSAATGTLIFGTTEIRQKIEGVDFAAEQDFGGGLRLTGGSLAPLASSPAVLLPQAAMDKLGVQIGETVIFKSQTASGQINVSEFTVAAAYTGQSMVGAGSGYASLPLVNAQLGLAADACQTVNIWLTSTNDIDRLTLEIQRELSALAPVWPRETDDGSNPATSMLGSLAAGGNRAIDPAEAWQGTKFRVSSLNDLMSTFMSIITTIELVSFWIFIILVVITMVGIMNSYRMVLVERTGEIGTMRAIGVQRGSVRSIFLLEALFIALIGAAGGFVLALAVLGGISLPDLGTQDMLGFFLDRGHLGVGLALADVLRNAVVLCAMSVAAVWLPARSAARLQPAEALRTVY